MGFFVVCKLIVCDIGEIGSGIEIEEELGGCEVSDVTIAMSSP